MKRKELLYLSICIFLTIVAWLSADLYHAANQKATQEEIANPILLKYKIDPQVLKLIENKQ